MILKIGGNVQTQCFASLYDINGMLLIMKKIETNETYIPVRLREASDDRRSDIHRQTVKYFCVFKSLWYTYCARSAVMLINLIL